MIVSGSTLKFHGLAGGALGRDACNRVLAEVSSLEKAATLDGLLASQAISR